MGLYGKAREKLGGNGLDLVPERHGTQYLVACARPACLLLGKVPKIDPYILCLRHRQ